MNQLEIFEHPQFGEIRVLTIDNEPWWVLADVCRVLDIGNASDVKNRLDEDERMTIDLTEGHSGKRGGAQKQIVVNESGLYSVILRSDKQEAKTFKRWVTHEVLPSIRKNGGYIAGQERLNMTREELQAAALAESRFFDYFNGFMKWCEETYPTDKATILYIKLLHTFNRRGWEEWTSVNTPLLMLLTNATRKETAYRARDALVRAGLLEYKPGIKGKPSSYRLLVYGAPALRCGSVK